MSMTFNEYVIDWWKDYLSFIDEGTAKQIMENEFIGEEEAVEDYIPEDAESVIDWLDKQDDDGEKIYKIFFGPEATDCVYDNIPDTDAFLTDMFMHCAGWYNNPDSASKPSFAESFVADMAYHAEDYKTPLGFFQDLTHGCQSGMIGMLIYNSDCKEIYIKHIDDMEEWKLEEEESLGESIRNKNHIPHYTWMCWLCYEELGFQIARILFPDTF